MDELNNITREVSKANKDLVKYNLVLFTWGNVSSITKDRRYIVIKPSGIPYEKLTPEKMIVLDINGKIVEGRLKPSSDAPTHLELYRKFLNVKSIVHTHSRYATSFAQAKCPIRVLGTTHADYSCGDIPVTRDMSKEEVKSEYELNTGKVIVETFKENNLSSEHIPGCLVASHGVFVWGSSCKISVHNAVVLEEIAAMNIYTHVLNKKINQLSKHIHNKHYSRKHGKHAYYGQR